MKGWKLSFCFAAFAVLVLALADRAEAACESEHRVSDENSQCLEASHTAESYIAYNLCAHKIRVKVDVKRGRDTTVDVPAAGSQYGRVEGSIS